MTNAERDRIVTELLRRLRAGEIPRIGIVEVREAMHPVSVNLRPADLERVELWLLRELITRVDREMMQTEVP